MAENSMEARVKDLEDRAAKFLCMELPGQPMGMHMGTSYLVHDLISAIRDLMLERAALAPPVRDEP